MCVVYIEEMIMCNYDWGVTVVRNTHICWCIKVMINENKKLYYLPIYPRVFIKRNKIKRKSIVFMVVTII